MHFFRSTVKGLKSDEDLETIITLRSPGSEYDKAKPIGKLVKQVLIIGVFTPDEFLQFADYLKESHDVESSRGYVDEPAA